MQLCVQLERCSWWIFAHVYLSELYYHEENWCFNHTFLLALLFFSSYFSLFPAKIIWYFMHFSLSFLNFILFSALPYKSRSVKAKYKFSKGIYVRSLEKSKFLKEVWNDTASARMEKFMATLKTSHWLSHDNQICALPLHSEEDKIHNLA